jgi:hypothetical protein
MAYKNKVIVNPTTGQLIKFLKTSKETKASYRLEARVK